MSKNGPFTTLQQGLNAANDGDTVLVGPGVYNGTAQVNDNGIRLLAQGMVILDGRPNGPFASGPVLTISGDDVTVQGFTIRNAGTFQAPPGGLSSQGHGVISAGSGTKVSRCVFINCSDDSILIEGDGATVENCTIFGGAGDGIDIEGIGAVVTRNRIQGIVGFGIAVDGDDASITGNTVRNVQNTGIVQFGSGGQVTRNTLQSVGDDGIRCTGDTVVVERNTITATGGRGISVIAAASRVNNNVISDVDSLGLLTIGVSTEIMGNRISGCQGRGIDSVGDSAKVTRNTVTNTGDRAVVLNSADESQVTQNRIKSTLGGIDVNGSNVTIERNTLEQLSANAIDVNGDNPSICRNTVKVTTASGVGIQVESASQGRITDNRLTDIAATGLVICVSADGLVVDRNQLKLVGSGLQNGFLILGDSTTVTNNRIQGASKDGINVQGGSNLLQKNTISDCAEDGIDINGGSNNEVDANRVTNCGAEGIENNGTNTVITGNTSKFNRTDFANDGTVNDFSGNISGDGTDDSTPPAVDT